MYLVMDFYPDGSIVDAMKTKQFTKENKITMCHQLAIGAYHLKSEGIFHGDIGARNCLINLSSQPIGIAITDFGIFRILFDDFSIMRAIMHVYGTKTRGENCDSVKSEIFRKCF